MNKKDNINVKAWEFFKFIIFISGMISFFLGFLAFYFRVLGPVVCVGLLFHPVLVVWVWRVKAGLFLKEGIER